MLDKLKKFIKNILTNTVCGLEMDGPDLRIFLSSRKNDNLHDIRYFSEILPSGIVNNGVINDEKEITEVLKRAALKYEFKKVPLVTVINSRSIVTRYLELPKMPAKELKSAVKWEAEQYLPYTTKEAVIDFVNLGVTRNNHPSKIAVLVAAVPRDIVLQYFKVFKKSGLKLVAIDLFSSALKRWLFVMGKKKWPDTEHVNTCIVNLGNELANLVIIEKGQTVFARSLNFDCKILQNERIMNGSENELNGLKIRSVMQEMLEETKKSLDYCYSHLSVDSVVRIILTGKLGDLQKIYEVFKGYFDIAVEMGNVQFKGNIDIPLEMCVAAGLSLRDV